MKRANIIEINRKLEDAGWTIANARKGIAVSIRREEGGVVGQLTWRFGPGEAFAILSSSVAPSPRWEDFSS